MGRVVGLLHPSRSRETGVQSATRFVRDEGARLDSRGRRTTTQKLTSRPLTTERGSLKIDSFMSECPTIFLTVGLKSEGRRNNQTFPEGRRRDTYQKTFDRSFIVVQKGILYRYFLTSGRVFSEVTPPDSPFGPPTGRRAERDRRRLGDWGCGGGGQRFCGSHYLRNSVGSFGRGGP